MYCTKWLSAMMAFKTTVINISVKNIFLQVSARTCFRITPKFRVQITDKQCFDNLIECHLSINIVLWIIQDLFYSWTPKWKKYSQYILHVRYYLELNILLKISLIGTPTTLLSSLKNYNTPKSFIISLWRNPELIKWINI